MLFLGLKKEDIGLDPITLEERGPTPWCMAYPMRRWKKGNAKMKNIYSVELINGITVIRFNNKPETQDVIDASDEAAKVDKNGLRLWDFSKGLDVSANALEKIADHVKSIPFSPSKIAIFAPDDLTFGLARVHEVYRHQENQEYRAFRTEQEAIDWLLQE